MGGDHGAGVDHGVAHGLRLFAQAGIDPHRRQAERGIARGNARQRGDDVARIDGEEQAGTHVAAADFHALERDAIAVRIYFEVVADMHGGRQETDFAGELLADALDAAHQFAVGSVVHQRNQAVADFQPQGVDGATSSQLASCDSTAAMGAALHFRCSRGCLLPLPFF